MHEDILPDNIKHKIIFFFMPESIVFGKAQMGDDIDLVTLKSISPCFYWCSAHEFPEFEQEYRYLFQYQIYSLEGSKMEPSEIYQKWHKNKNKIREDIMSFIDTWQSHKRILMAPENKNEKDEIHNGNYNKIYNFKEFAPFVAQSIFKLQKFYIEQASMINFDVLQKEFWKMIAMNNSMLGDYKTIDCSKKIKKPVKKKKRNVKTRKSIKNEK